MPCNIQNSRKFTIVTQKFEQYIFRCNLADLATLAWRELANNMDINSVSATRHCRNFKDRSWKYWSEYDLGTGVQGSTFPTARAEIPGSAFSIFYFSFMNAWAIQFSHIGSRELSWNSDMAEDCTQERDMDLRIGGCTAGHRRL